MRRTGKLLPNSASGHRNSQVILSSSMRNFRGPHIKESTKAFCQLDVDIASLTLERAVIKKKDEELEQIKICFPYKSFPHDIVLKEASFLPTLNGLKCSENDKLSTKLQSALNQIQSPTSCRNNQHFMSSTAVGYGVGSLVSSWIKVGSFILNNSLLLLTFVSLIYFPFSNLSSH